MHRASDRQNAAEPRPRRSPQRMDRLRRCSAASALFVVMGLIHVVAAQPPPPSCPPAPPQRRQDYPVRPPGDPAAIERGKALYGVNCQFCHGADTRGGDGGPSLLRSRLVLDDRPRRADGAGRSNGRPLAACRSSRSPTSRLPTSPRSSTRSRAAGYDESRLKPPSIVVGDAKAGEAFFTAKCASCHSTTGDLRGLATKIPDPRLLQQTWLMPGSGGGRGGRRRCSVAADDRHGDAAVGREGRRHARSPRRFHRSR